MYFVHPQIKYSKESFLNLLYGFLNVKGSDLELKNYFKQFLGKDFSIAFLDMGRTAFSLAVEQFNLQNSKIIFPAFLCDIFYPYIKKYNIDPVFVDADINNFNMSLEDLKNKYSPKIKAVFVVHTFGEYLPINKVREIVGDKTIIIEDCAHRLFGPQGDIGGKEGDAIIFSFYKHLPCARGGALALRNKDIENLQLKHTTFTMRDFLSLLNHIPFFANLFRKLGGGAAKKYQKKEKFFEPVGLCRTSKNLTYFFVEDFRKTIENRVYLANVFKKELEKLGFVMQDAENSSFCFLSGLMPENLADKRDDFVVGLRKYNIFCTRIWKDPIILNDELIQDLKINTSEFQNTLEISKRIINFPLQNHYTEKDIYKMIYFTRKQLELLK
ncbi:GDP-perosamine synthase [bacterium HR34]|nr:GDP-perosamine synthase [bacterium HR34]